jgi:hypothetical protein
MTYNIRYQSRLSRDVIYPVLKGTGFDKRRGVSRIIRTYLLMLEHSDKNVFSLEMLYIPNRSHPLPVRFIPFTL